VIRRRDYLMSEASEIKSCGCKHPRTYFGIKHGRWRGFGEIPGETVARIKNNAKIRNISFKISGTFLWNLFLKQNRRCALTGVLLKFVNINLPVKERDGTTASLDRIDSTKPYTEDNVQWVHKDINMLKKKFSQEKFIKMCRLVAKHYTSKVARTTPLNNGNV
jgi:hypothetical protein